MIILHTSVYDIMIDNLGFKNKIHTPWTFIPILSEFIFILPFQFLQELLHNFWLAFLFPSLSWILSYFSLYICSLSSFLPSPHLTLFSIE